MAIKYYTMDYPKLDWKHAFTKSCDLLYVNVGLKIEIWGI